MNLAVIPARGGSKRIPRKNIKLFNGKPMIAWSIEVAINSGVFDKVIVSTDDAEIMEIARYYGAEVPFVRPEALSNDYAGTIEVIAHAVKWAQDEALDPTNVCCLYATAPFIEVTDLARGLDEMNTGRWQYAFPVTAFSASIFRAFKASSSTGVEMFYPEHFKTRSQDLPVAYHDAGQFYWGKATAWLAAKPIFDAQSYPIIIPSWRVQDIDTPEDWERAEKMASLIFLSDK